MAEKIKRELGVEAELIEGGMGELIVLVDGEKVAKKGWFTSPSDEKILDAVREAIK